MKISRSLSQRIVLYILFYFIAMSSLTNQYVAAQNKSQASGSSTPSAAHELTPDTILIKLQPDASQPPIELSLKQFMEKYNIPGLSVAVIDNYKIVYAKGFGVTAPGGSEPVTTSTLFQAASISKTVAAVGAMRLVEQGKLSLDEDVNNKLKTWKVPENEFTAKEKVTLRRLMSHSAGLTVHGFPGYAVNTPVPTLVQIFNGEKPANNQAIRVDFVPGSKMRYSGGGITIEQQLMMDVTGQPFPQFMHDTVLSKIGMTNSSYEQPLPAARATHTATGTYANGKAVDGKWHVYPEMAAAGLWTTPTDLAKFAIEIALSKQGKANHVLSQKSVQEMLTPQIKAEGGDDPIGLAFFLEKKNPDEFGHNGSNEGFQSNLVMLADSGKGIALMGNSDAFFAVAPYVFKSIEHEYDWKYHTEPMGANQAIMMTADFRGPQAALAFYKKIKQGEVADYRVDESSLNQLGYHMLIQKKNEDAINIFKLNVEQYPQSWNCYDSLGEAYMNAGQKDLAIKSYEKSLELNPQNMGGAAALKKLREGN